MKEKRGQARRLQHCCGLRVCAHALVLALPFFNRKKTMNQPLPSRDMRIAIVSASWHRDIVMQSVDALRADLERGGVAASGIDHFEVPGAFEIPLHAKTLAQTGRYDAILACGLVVNGGIYRHEFVASAVIDGLMRVQLDTGVPVLSVVLTPRDFHEHEDHQRFFHDHFRKKGAEAAAACLATVNALRAIAS
jgi:6,7-dimethyl-8-ribityllumazine synthase